MLYASHNTMINANSLLKEYIICHFDATSKHLSREASVSASPRTSHASRNVADVQLPKNVIMLYDVSYGTVKTNKTYRSEYKKKDITKTIA
jgi:hypothetical protein